MVSSLKTISIILIGSATTGCVFFPVPIYNPGSAPPFERHQPFIQVGKTTRAQVVSRLGAPTVKRFGGRFLGYAGYQRHGAVCFPVVALIPYVGMACFDKDLTIGEWGYPRTDHFMGIEFDERSIVSRVTISSSSGSLYQRPCVTTDVCLDHGQSIVFAPLAQDTAAKRFASDPQYCLIYLVRVNAQSEEWQPRWLFPVRLDGKLAGESSQGTYLVLLAQPGRHEITTTLRQDTGHDPHEDASVQVDCASGEIVYVQQDPLGHLHVVPALIGQKDVLNTRRILGHS